MIRFEITLPELSIGNRLLAHEIKWTCHGGEFWCILGSNGSGKTTLLHTLAGLNKKHLRNIYINNEPLQNFSHKERAQLVGLLLQDKLETLYGNTSEAISTAYYPHASKLKKSSLTHLNSILEKLDLLHLANSPIATLSGGEQQRLHVAMLIAQNPQIFLLDEPTNHLDFKHQYEILNLLKDFSTKQNKLIIAVLHDINLAAQYADHFCFIYPDNEVEVGKKQELFTEEKLSRLLQCKIQKIISEENKEFYYKANAFQP